MRNPTTRVRNVCYRVAALAGWCASFNLMGDKTVVSRRKMEAALMDAGRFVGSCGGHSIGKGRFIAERCEVREPDAGATA